MSEAELDALAEALLLDSRRINNCDTVRRYCCSYHQGFRDGMDMIMQSISHE